MHESILRDFFTDRTSIDELVHDLDGAIVADGSCVARHPIVDMAGEFTVRSSHLMKICDAFSDGHLKPDNLRAIGFCLIASDAFEWDADTSDGERVTDVTNHWSSPEINYPINADNVAKWKTYLATGNDVFNST